MSPQTLLYREAIDRLSGEILIDRTRKQADPKSYIVATHGPALVKAVKEDPTVLDRIGIYRVNCSHLGKESDWDTLAEYLRCITPHCEILIDLQGPKPRIHELHPSLNDKLVVKKGDTFTISYAEDDDDDRFCTADHLTVCFPEIVQAMEVGDLAVFDDGKMTAIVREVTGDTRRIECSEIAHGETYTLKGRKGICVRNKPLGIDCITAYDHTCIDFARDILGFDSVDFVMVSYFLSIQHIHDFVHIIRDHYGYTGRLGAKFETPFAVKDVDAILKEGAIRLAMFGRGDLRVEMDLRAIPNIHSIQPHFFAACQRYEVESICATGFLESMMTEDGNPVQSEIDDMRISMQTGADHLMLSAESSYGPQARRCIDTEAEHQRQAVIGLQDGTLHPRAPESTLSALLYLS